MIDDKSDSRILLRLYVRLVRNVLLAALASGALVTGFLVLLFPLLGEDPRFVEVSLMAASEKAMFGIWISYCIFLFGVFLGTCWLVVKIAVLYLRRF